MEQSEVMKRVVGILTEAGEWARQLEEGRERDEVDTSNSLATEMLNEALAYRIALPASASHQQIADAMNEQWTNAVHQLVGAFTVAFVELAHVHDSGYTDVTSAEVLRQLALRNDAAGNDS